MMGKNKERGREEEKLEKLKDGMRRAGLRCMGTAAAVLVILFLLYNESALLAFLPVAVFMFIQKAVTVCFIIGVIVYLCYMIQL